MGFISNLKIKSQNQKGDIDQLLSRMGKAEVKIDKIEKKCVELKI